MPTISAQFRGLVRFAISLAVWTNIACVPLHAQEAPTIPSIPPGPLLRPAPSNARWAVEFQYGEEKELGSPKRAMGLPRVKTTIAARSGQVTYEEATDEAGMKTEKWILNGEQYTRKPGSSDFYTARKCDVANANYEYFSPTGFRGFHWVSKEKFVGIQNALGHECLVFSTLQDEQELRDPDAFALLNEMRASRKVKECVPGGMSIEVTAFIDLDSRLPVALRIGRETRIFSFLEPSAVQVTLPPELVSHLVKRQKLWDQLVRAAPSP